MLERLLAALTLAVCAALFVRLLLSERRRYRFDAAARRAWAWVQGRCRALYHWPASRRKARAAAQAAATATEQVIRRARERAIQEGNVFRPKSWRKPSDE
jgi:hypothetical protein